MLEIKRFKFFLCPCLIALSALAVAVHLFGQSAEAKLELVVFCDVSDSLKLEAIKAEADVIFQFINSNTVFPSGDFTIHIANRDVEQDPAIGGSKVLTRFPDETIKQTRLLGFKKDQLVTLLTQYCKRNQRRNKTCLVKAIGSLSNLFKTETSSNNRRLLIVSDMLEDCYSQGDPRTAEQLRRHIQLSEKQYPLPDLTGVRSYALVVSSTASPMDIAELRNIWEAELRPTHTQFLLSTIQLLLHQVRTTL